MKEVVPVDAPKQHERPVNLRLFVDLDHACEKCTQGLQTRYFISLNPAPIVWLNQKQGTVETSVFGAEFEAMNAGIEQAL